MKTSLIVKNSGDDESKYSDLKVMHSAAGYYIGTTYCEEGFSRKVCLKTKKITKTNKGFEVPGSRDTRYMSEKEAVALLKKIEEDDEDALMEMRDMP